MNQITDGKSSISVPLEQIDWEAYAHLQKIRSRTSNPFNTEAIEIALDKALSPSKRKATGRNLAEDLFRDGRKKAAQSYHPESRLSKNFQEYQRLTPVSEDPDARLETNFKLALAVVKQALGDLDIRQATAIYLKLAGQNNASRVAQLLGVGLKQYRNILTKARVTLSATPGFEEAFMLLLLHSEEQDLISFFVNRIKDHLAASCAA